MLSFNCELFNGDHEREKLGSRQYKINFLQNILIFWSASDAYSFGLTLVAFLLQLSLMLIYISSCKFPVVCGGRLHASEEEEVLFSHVDYGKGNYASNTRCAWHLAAKDGYAIQIRFSFFELEEDDGCGFDFVKIKDGPNESAGEIARLCGTKTGRQFQSTGINMLILFKTDENEAKKGFALAYKRVKL